MLPMISKLYCSSSEKVFLVRRRPQLLVNGGGFVAIDCCQKVVFKVEGCGILGTKEELLLKDGDGNDVLLTRRKEGIVDALNNNMRWKGYNTSSFEGYKNPVFTLKEQNSCLHNNIITIEPAKDLINTHHFELKGDFATKQCSIVDSHGSMVAQVGIQGEITVGKDVYHVVVKPGMDQAFVFGVIAILDYMYDGSARC